MIARADPTLVLGLGDLTYADERSQADVDRHFDDVMVWSRRAAYMPVWGNHEWDGKGRPAQLQGALRAAQRRGVSRRARGGLLRRGLVLVRPGRRPLHHLPGAVREGDVARLGAPGRAAVRRRPGRPGAALHRDGGPPARVQLGRARRQGADPRDPRRLRGALRQIRPQPRRRTATTTSGRNRKRTSSTSPRASAAARSRPPRPRASGPTARAPRGSRFAPSTTASSS